VRLRQVDDFVAVVESGSMRAAARKLAVSQPAITKSIRSLEGELHSRLVQRTPHGVVPTPAGRVFLARARAVQSELRKAEEEVTQLSGGTEGSLAFGIGPSAIPVLPDAVGRFRRLFPRARLHILEGYTHSLLPLVREGTLDFTMGVRIEAKLDPAFAFRPLFRVQYAIVARKGHPLRRARSLAQLADAEWLSLTPQGSSSGPLDRAFSSAGLPSPAHAIRCDSHNVAMALLTRADMICIMSGAMLSQSPARDVLQVIPVADAMPSYTVGMFTRVDSVATPLASAMAKAAAAAARRVAFS
jgi:DNA-binding transcriptional LysR family regulator